jgi:hypothetical protein
MARHGYKTKEICLLEKCMQYVLEQKRYEHEGCRKIYKICKEIIKRFEPRGLSQEV